MVTQPKTYTADEFYEFVHRPENYDRMFERHDGEIIEMPPSNLYSSIVGGQFITYFNIYNNEHKLGWVSGEAGAFIIDDENTFVPDATGKPATGNPVLTTDDGVRVG